MQYPLSIVTNTVTLSAMKTLGELVAAGMERREMSGKELGAAIGRDGSFISRIVTGRMKELPTPHDLEGISREIGVPVRELIVAAGYKLDEPNEDEGSPELREVLAVARLVEWNDDRLDTVIGLMRIYIKKDQDARKQGSN